jgi:hypothetical protein
MDLVETAIRNVLPIGTVRTQLHCTLLVDGECRILSAESSSWEVPGDVLLNAKGEYVNEILWLNSLFGCGAEDVSFTYVTEIKLLTPARLVVFNLTRFSTLEDGTTFNEDWALSNVVDAKLQRELVIAKWFNQATLTPASLAVYQQIANLLSCSVQPVGARLAGDDSGKTYDCLLSAKRTAKAITCMETLDIKLQIEGVVSRRGTPLNKSRWIDPI